MHRRPQSRRSAGHGVPADAGISKALDSAQSELGGTAPTPQDIRKLISRRFDVDNVTSIAAKDIEITRLSQGYKVEADYEGRATYIANLSLVAKF